MDKLRDVSILISKFFGIYALYIFVQLIFYSLIKITYNFYGILGSALIVIITLYMLYYFFKDYFATINRTITIKYLIDIIRLYLISIILKLTLLGVFKLFLKINTTMSSNQKQITSTFTHDFSNMVTIVLLSLCIAPLFEEYLCRELLFKKININLYLIIFVSSSIFSFLHFPSSVNDFLQYFPLGITLGWCYKKYGYFGSVGLHLFNNIIALMTMFYTLFRS